MIRPSPWPGAPLTWAPLGYRPSPNRPRRDRAALRAGATAADGDVPVDRRLLRAFLVVPLCGALTVFLTYELGRRVFGRPGIALWGAALVATSPVFLYQLMNAMSDVPVTAAWTLALVLAIARRPLTAGLAMSAAIAIRPNLAPLAALLCLWTASSDGWRAVTPFRDRYAPSRWWASAYSTRASTSRR